MDVHAIPVTALAVWQMHAMGAAEYEPAAVNLQVARELGQLHIDVEDDHVTGYVGFVRLTMEQLRELSRTRKAVFSVEDDQPNAPVCFLVEQLNTRPGQMRRRMRELSAIPGVEVLAGWRNGRLRVHRVRAKS